VKNKQISFNVPNSDLIRLLCVTIFIFVWMTLMRPALFLRPANFLSMGYQLPELGLYSLAMMMVMVTGGRDLSIVGIGNLAAIMAAYILHPALVNGLGGTPLVMVILAAVLAALLIGAACGIVNGIIVAYMGIPAMLATMATSSIFTGIGIVITRGEAFSKVPPEFLYFGGNTFLKIPIPLWLLIIALAASAYLLNMTKFGFEVKMVGSNRMASHYSGINTEMVLIKAYVFSGIMCALCGLEIVARTDAAKADYAYTYTFQAILAAVLGATNPNGGFAKISCIILSLLSLQFLSSGFNMLRLGSWFKEFTWGLLLILVLSMDVFIVYYRKQKSIKAVIKSRAAGEEAPAGQSAG
jgi:simple sugar transport system permease protein